MFAKKRAGTAHGPGPKAECSQKTQERGTKPQSQLSGRRAKEDISVPLREHARAYIAKGWKLVPVCDKKPMGDEWNTRTVMRTEADIDKQLRKHRPANGVGVLLAESGLCSFDPDDLERTRKGLAKLGIDTDAVLDSGWRIESGKDNSARALFALPKGTPLQWMRLAVRKPRDQWGPPDKDGVRRPKNTIVFELRAQSPNLQDVLPPSVHPCGSEYSAPALPKRMPALARPLLELWRRWQANPKEVEAELFDAFDVPQEDRVPSLAGKPGKLDFPSRARMPYNDANSVEELLERHGYEEHAGGRWSRPGATGAPGCRAIPGKDGLWRSDNGGDSLRGTFDAWTAHVVLDHSGDPKAAEEAWYAEHPKGSEFAPIEDDLDVEPAPTRRTFALHFGTEIVEDEMEYLVEPLLPLGLVVALYGAGGTGKSSLCATLAAAASKGGPVAGLRDGNEGDHMRGSTLWLSSEEPKEWITSRHLACGGVPGSIVIPKIDVLEHSKDGRAVRTSYDLERDLRATIEQANEELSQRQLPRVRFVVLDTAVALVRWGKERSPNNDDAVKGVMLLLGTVAAEMGCCVLVVGHTNKDYRAPSAAFRVAGAGAWVTSTRLPMFAERDENDPDRLLLTSIRNSTGPEFGCNYWLREVHTLRHMQTLHLPDGSPVRTSLQGVERFGAFAWNRSAIDKLRVSFAPVPDPADELEAKPAKKSKRERVVEWIATRTDAHGSCKRAELPPELALSSGADWKHVEFELSQRGVARFGRSGNSVTYWSTSARELLS